MNGTQGTWRIETSERGVPRIVAYGLGRYRDESRIVATFRDESILSNEDARLVVAAVNEFRRSASVVPGGGQPE